MYCNPSIDVGSDTGELRRGFRAPPKSDGKTFSPYHLFTLIAKLEDKKDGIENWTTLVLELGVEPPDQDKRQSSQKLQQYAVRLKVSCHLLCHLLSTLKRLVCFWHRFIDLHRAALVECLPCGCLLRLSS